MRTFSTAAKYSENEQRKSVKRQVKWKSRYLETSRCVKFLFLVCSHYYSFAVQFYHTGSRAKRFAFFTAVR